MVLIGAKIKELRNSCKFTQKELADLVGVTNLLLRHMRMIVEHRLLKC